MRKILAIIILVMFSFCAIYAQKLNTAQQKLKTDIFNYLKKEVTNLTDYSTTDLKFSYNGTTYFVSVSESDFAPMYVTLYAGFNMPSDYDKDVVVKAGQQMNLYKGVKFYSGDDFIKFQAEMFMNDYKPFATAFKSLVGVMGTMRESFDDEYEKSKPKYSTSSSFTSQFKKQSGEYIWPYSKTSNDNRLFVSKVTLGKESTILDFISYNGAEYQWCSIDKNSYLLVNGKRYTLKKAEGIAYSPQHTNYPNYQSGGNVSLSFRLHFQPIPAGTSTFDFAESVATGWSVKSITLEDANVVTVSGTPIETSVHKWELVSVQCMSNQTVLCKKVTPKEAGTWINSSQEEFIEDADTGRKYYLTKSDIGFESNKRTIYDTKERTFYEVYPALPANVKRINVSSGTQYYVKNLKIR